MRVVNLAYGAVRYERPTITSVKGRQQWLDICRELGSNCGAPAAEAFCRQRDPAKPDVLSFTGRPNAYITATITGGQICIGDHCAGFEQITCASRAVTDYKPDKPRAKLPTDKLTPP
jgi:hypothetical protein